YECLVAGHVDDAEAWHPVALELGEAELDGDPALRLLLQPIRVDAGERAYERRLPVVDVSGRAQDEAPHVSTSWSGGKLAARKASALRGFCTTWCAMKSASRPRWRRECARSSGSRPSSSSSS